MKLLSIFLWQCSEVWTVISCSFFPGCCGLLSVLDELCVCVCGWGLGVWSKLFWQWIIGCNRVFTALTAWGNNSRSYRANPDAAEPPTRQSNNLAVAGRVLLMAFGFCKPSIAGKLSFDRVKVKEEKKNILRCFCYAATFYVWHTGSLSKM